MTNKFITQICVVVEDVRQANANWSKILGQPEAPVETIFAGGIVHFTNGEEAVYTDLQVAKYQLDHLVLELMQPGESPSPWRTFLEKNGPGVFHFCMQVEDRKEFQQKLSDISVEMPYHIGYFPAGSYSYVDSREQLGLELSVNTDGDFSELVNNLSSGAAIPMAEFLPEKRNNNED